MFEEVKNSVEDAIDISDMFEFGGPSLVMARRFPTKFLKLCKDKKRKIAQ